jgi:signal transduction histidine kinase
LVVRTLLTLTVRRRRLHLLWPFIDVGLITATLIVLRNPSDALFVLYFIPLASAVALFNSSLAFGLAAATAAAYLLVVQVSGELLWSIATLYRVGILAVMASLYSWIVRTVGLYERAVERAEFQRQLAREIHDGVQHLLVTLGIRLELASRLVTDNPQRAKQILAAEQDTTRRAADELRYLVRRLRAAPQADLVSALRTQIAAMADRWSFDLDVSAPPTLPRLSPAAELAVLRTIQESLTNTARHARASRAGVQVAVADGVLRCTITDDGAGFDPTHTEEGGLAGLRERIQAAGGILEVQSALGRGTTVTATFPLPRARR